MHPFKPTQFVKALLTVLSLSFASLTSPSASTHCGPNTLPHSFEARNDGQAVLGCVRPTCFVLKDNAADLDGDLLKQISYPLGVKFMSPGQKWLGGAVDTAVEGRRGHRAYAFDYVEDVKQHGNNGMKVSYDVSVRRMTCLPPPREREVKGEFGGV